MTDQAVDQITDALARVENAENNAAEALRISRANSDQLMGLAVSQQRTEGLLNEHRAKSEERHVEVMAAIEGAKATDAKQAAKIGELESNLSNKDVGKIAGAVVALIMAIVAILTALAPVLPQVVQARYATPVVVTVTAPPSTPPPAPSATGAPTSPAPTDAPAPPTTAQVTP